MTVTCATPGAVIHYTLNGAEPTEFDPVVSSGNSVLLKRSLTLKAKAWVSSDVSSTASMAYGITGEISSGAQHVLSLKSNGVVNAWGPQLYGRLGNGVAVTTNTDATSPVSSARSSGAITNGVALAAGYYQSVVLDSFGNPWCFGYNSFGELGNNGSSHSSTAVQVVKSSGNLGGCIAVAAGQYMSGALSFDGKVYTWGSHANGRLGFGMTTGSRGYADTVRTALNTDLTGISAIEFGDTQGLALASDGKVWGWGANTNGQLGTGVGGNQAYAAKVQISSSGGDLTDVTDISSADNHSAVVRWNGSEQGTVWTFGNDGNGRLGDGNTSGNVGYPTKVKTSSTPTYLTNIVQVSAGSAHTLALDASGHVWAWGYNGLGALGNPSAANNTAFATQVRNPSDTGALQNIVWISAGGITANNFSVAVAADGTVYTWGVNNNGQLANGSNTGSRSLPAAVANLKLLPGSPDTTLSATVSQSVSPGAATLTAAPTDPDGTGNIQKVEFYSAGALVGTKTAAPWVLGLTGLSAGSYYNYAVVTDSDGNQGFSLPTTFSIISSDADGDGLLDAWETSWFGNTTSQSGSGDPDGDGVTNAQEYGQGTNPLSPADGDGDGLPDDWEIYYFGNLSRNGTEDYDHDGLSDSWEFHHKTTVKSLPAQLDSDGDGLPDDWENYYFTTGVSTNPGDDYDQDGVSNADEYALGLNPASDADGDGNHMADDWEIFWFGSASQDPDADPDGDGLTNAQEYALRLNPVNADTDGDGMPDGYEVYYQFAPKSAANDPVLKNGPGDDKDGDGLTNLQEAQKGRIANSAGEYLQVTSTSPKAIKWFAVRDKYYRLQWSTNMTTWTNEPNYYVGANQEISRLVSAVAGSEPSVIYVRALVSDRVDDKDGDGMTDDWEIAHGLDPYSDSGANGPSGDSDGDGVPNSHDTRPNSASSGALTITITSPANGSTVP
ncbi:chitobiase/beta-hexosaminidase C-terminal domain-containing protein [Luteolibacter ambystomatis]|uniref:Chitobiase/beta-hexosaminidase C-terminal domain-containing protein n=1 Tax=Luteolibacter ambystomatis TaxID=2824561 RepID=A0A975G7F1_9BACT|nr:chitobiase/beta-hexosaminidase C-terminal domain-containing protein [Luteolibacter ambystomatis]